MKARLTIVCAALIAICAWSCENEPKKEKEMTPQKYMTAKDILGNPNYQAISYGGYREISREYQPTIAELKEDLRILSAMDIKVLRTYNVQLAQAFNLLIAIRQLKEEDSNFEMYVMLGAWIDCKNAWTGLTPDHNAESEHNESEIARAAALANQFPDIVKVVAVGNEAMVKWAASYYVQPNVILKWVNHLQQMKADGKLPKDLWITSSDDFASWGGGEDQYHVEDLNKLIEAVDYISMHTYPYHNTHYNPEFWGVPENEQQDTDLNKIDAAMERAIEFSKKQYDSVKSYMKSIGADKPIHIGETGWATISSGQYGPTGSKATDEYKQGAYYRLMRDWTNSNNISCFYFEAFNERWKDAHNPKGSENHFGLFTLEGQAKYPIWDLVDKGIFKGLTRNGNPITKTYDGNLDLLMEDVLVPPTIQEVMSHR
ncbi:glycosyl hydrolase family 17 protein [Psychroserpens sp.]|uniref:glycosyl hydrolase family 17 protein n=1 Tax=Psychroserpens sp. TaxID=2020870 RepID=UPI001B2F4EE3|nr:glycosyl hydrolase family 17 [Psychroserpens sp.]MBO6631263.1 glycosyl hydrolase family 17 [Psychroserpens sp.]MBO6654544.1 glycosyl hydrolase family 17 [Psychroserpens sp.]MBO6681107.1 glycosyl hydrolase family 17 [Psychroserpens sp.]MBO6749936.1 glycosyl hydrolase family 17 [Psychroserpens sp.]